MKLPHSRILRGRADLRGACMSKCIELGILCIEPLRLVSRCHFGSEERRASRVRMRVAPAIAYNRSDYGTIAM